MLIKTFPVGAFQCNCTLIADPNSGEAIVVDPGDEGERIAQMIREQGLTLKYLIHTHAHIDHIGATRSLHEACGGAVCLHKADQFLYDNIAMQGEFLGLNVDGRTAKIQKYIEHGDVIESSGLRLEVLHTPGHTPGSVCFYGDKLMLDGKPAKIMFAGDTLFMGSIGRTDLWGGDTGQIMASLREQIMTAPPETLVVCGHGPMTTIARELKSNPFLQE